MTRARRTPESSLELLLDTMCNTFGGVLFLAILICVLLRTTSRFYPTSKASASTHADVLAVRLDHEQTLRKLEELMAAARQHDALIKTFATPDTSAAIEELRKLRDVRDAVLAERGRLAVKIAKLQEKGKKRDADENQLKTLLEAARSEATALERALQAEVAKRTQVVRLPRIHQSSKHEVPVAIAHGRLYFIFKHDADGSSLGLNTDEIDVGGDLLGKQVAPKPNRGLAIRDQATSRERLRTALGRFDKDGDYLALAVWADSFDTFQQVKATAVELGFDYRLIPLEPGGKISVGGSAGGDVQ